MGLKEKEKEDFRVGAKEDGSIGERAPDHRDKKIAHSDSNS